MFTLLVETGGLTLCEGESLLGSLAVRRTWLCKLLVGSAVLFVLLSFSGVSGGRGLGWCWCICSESGCAFELRPSSSTWLYILCMVLCIEVIFLFSWSTVFARDSFFNKGLQAA